MKQRRLGRTDLMVSELCLGSMTWGTQNAESEGHGQIDMALDHGINFIDTAEMYPTNPLSKETQGDTERIIGSWVRASGRRDDVIIATKVSGKGYGNVRNGAAISPKTITQALDASLQSLETDYIDLYQLHWPNRGSYMFRQNWHYDPSDQDSKAIHDDMLAVLNALDGHIKAGKIRHIGLSNETAWGLSKWAQLAENHNLPRMVSVQNEYSLLCRLFDTDLAEASHNEDIGLLAYSPLAAGLLSGKYAPTITPEGSRRSYNDSIGGRITPRIWAAIDRYKTIADNHGIGLVPMALAWCLTRPFMTSVIFGATSLGQLKTILKTSDTVMNDGILADIADAHKDHPLPY